MDGLAVDFLGMHDSHFIGVLFYLFIGTNGRAFGELKRRRLVGWYGEQDVILNVELYRESKRSDTAVNVTGEQFVIPLGCWAVGSKCPVRLHALQNVL